MKQYLQKNAQDIIMYASLIILTVSFIALVALAFTTVDIAEMFMLSDFGMLVEVWIAHPVLTAMSLGAFIVSGIVLRLQAYVI